MKSIILGATIALLLGGCASIVEGTSQSITVALTPDTATCVATLQGGQIGVISGSYRNISISKKRYDIQLRCTAPDHQTAEVKVESGASGCGVVGAVTLDIGLNDWATVAPNKYPDTVTVALIRRST